MKTSDENIQVLECAAKTGGPLDTITVLQVLADRKIDKAWIIELTEQKAKWVAWANEALAEADEVKSLREQVRQLTEQRDALVVENAVIDSERLAWAELYGDEMGDPDVVEKAKGLPKPATDAARASLRAEGVEMFAVIMHADISETDALEFARQLRESKGSQS